MKTTKFLVLSFFVACSALADERQERDAIGANASQLFSARDFRSLEDVAEDYRVGREHTSAGMWKIRKFYGGIEDTVPADDPGHADWSAAIEIVDEWLELYPQSPTPHIAKAHLLMHWGWAYRGDGYAHTVATTDMVKLKMLAAESKSVLTENRDIASKDPEFYSILAAADLALGTEELEYRENLNEGLDRYPGYDELYFRAAEFYHPKWYGSEQALASIAAEAVERTKDERGFEMYARIYWAAGRDSNGMHYFRKPTADWKLIRSGILDLVNNSPDQWNINHLAFFACLRQDYALAAVLIQMIKEPVLESAWYRRSNLDLCKRKMLEQT